MKVYIYPVFESGRGYWSVMLRDNKDNIKHISGKNLGDFKKELYLKALYQGLCALKFPVDIIIFTQLKEIEIKINEGILEEWKENGWRPNKGVKIDNAILWEKIKSKMDIHKSVKCRRCRYIQDKYFYQSYQKLQENKMRR